MEATVRQMEATVLLRRTDARHDLHGAGSLTWGSYKSIGFERPQFAHADVECATERLCDFWEALGICGDG